MKLFLYPGVFPTDGEQLNITGGKYRYLIQVRRLQLGMKIQARDTNGNQAVLELEQVDYNSHQATFLVRDFSTVEPAVQVATGTHSDNAGIGIELVQGLPKGKKTDAIIRQAVEAGVRQIHLVATEFSIPQIDEDSYGQKKQRWTAIIHEAVQQSANPVVPALQYHSTLSHFIDVCDSGSETSLNFFFHQEDFGNKSLHEYVQSFREEHAGSASSAKIRLFIGPEGGFSSSECRYLIDHAFHSVFLGDTILRTETAGIFALGAVKTLLLEADRWMLRA